MANPTPNLKLDRIDANSKAWTVRMNSNLAILDSAFGAYFTLQNLQGVWENSHAYEVGQTVVDQDTGTVWTAQVDHTSAMIGTTFAEDRDAHTDFWTVFSSPARARGVWTGPGTNYAVNDFVVSGPKYAVAIVAHTSGSSFDADEAAGNWSVLIDLSAVGSQVLPVLHGTIDANKFTVTNSDGSGYTITDIAATMALLGVTSVGSELFYAASAADALAAIGAAPIGSYQPLDATLTTLSGLSTTSFGRALLNMANAAALRAAQGLGTAALGTTGTSAGNVVVLDGSAKLPAVDGSQLTNLPSPAVGFTTGDLKSTHKITADATWIMWSDGTIGDASSGATIRANADTSALYAVYWNGYTNTQCPVSGGARGANAAADFAAHRTIALPKGAGRVFGLAGSGSGLTTRTAGDVVGTETHALTADEQADMSVSGTYGGTDGTGSGAHGAVDAPGNDTGALGPITGTATGGGVTGDPHDIMQPTTWLKVMIKL